MLARLASQQEPSVDLGAPAWDHIDMADPLEIDLRHGAGAGEQSHPVEEDARQEAAQDELFMAISPL